MAASVTRILHLSGFSPAVTTKDIKHAFAAFDDLYKIKWIDDTSLYLVFNDPRIAKSAFLMMMDNLSPNILPAPNQIIQLSPYNGSDADVIIARVEQRSARSSSSRSEVPMVTNGVNLANISPAVSLMLLAATNTGPPGAISGVNGIGGVNRLQGVNGHAHGFTRRASQTTLRSVCGQKSLADAYGFGTSTSGYGPGVASCTNLGSPRASSSWTNMSPQFIPTTLNPYNDYPVALSFNVHHVTGKHTTANLSTDQGLDDIVEVSSREEIPGTAPQGLLSALAHKPITSSGTAFVSTTLPPSLIHPISHQDNLDLDEATHSPSSKSPSEPTANSEISPSTLSKKSSMDSLVESFSQIGVSSSRERSSPDHSMHTTLEPAPTNRPSTMKSAPPRIGNPGKRMLSHALGIRHPGLPPRVIAGVKEQTA